MIEALSGRRILVVEDESLVAMLLETILESLTSSAVRGASVDTVDMNSPDDLALADRMKSGRDQIIRELKKLIVGQDEVVNQVLLTLFVGGNSLIIGVPGLAKTLLIHTMARVLELKFSRIQFTPDLMPSDITGTDIIQEDPETGRRQFEFLQGPLFANICLADEINRTPPKTQSALLEAMQEHRVTVQGKTYVLQEPFFVFATQNPIELEGTYPLPEAQEIEVVTATTAIQDLRFERTVTGADIVAFQALVRRVPVAREVIRYAVQLARASRPSEPGAPDFVKRWVQYGASVRAAQYLVLGGKARALMQGRYNVSFDDIRALAQPVFRHRILTNFHAESERVSKTRIVEELLAAVPPPRSGM